MEKEIVEIIECRKCGRRLEVFVRGREITDVGRTIKEGITGCDHIYE